MSQTELESKLYNSWDTNADAWTNAIRSGTIRSRKVATDAAILEAVTNVHLHRALDVGCGEGWLARALTARGIEMVGVDGSASLIASAQAAGGGTFYTLSYDQIIADPAQLQGEYDTIICNFSLLGQDLVPLLRALKTSLAPLSHLLVQTVHPWIACGDLPYVDGWRDEKFSAFGSQAWEPMPWYFRTLESWLSVFRAAGFQLDQLHEPLDPETQRPLSLLLTFRPDPL
jgi:2-polyprenyl-3-methyl-5-hydroxy-6-metoxy-1,4-benzoquinol methylase